MSEQASNYNSTQAELPDSIWVSNDDLPGIAKQHPDAYWMTQVSNADGDFGDDTQYLLATPERLSARWRDPAKQLPDYLEGKDYSAPVLAIVKGLEGMQVMARCYIPGIDEIEGGWQWCNCYQNISGEEMCNDDDYEVLWWMPLPPIPGA